MRARSTRIRPNTGPARIIAFNKPYGVLSQFTGSTAPTLAGFGLPPGVYPAGRLDRDSEGLLLLSNDGRFIHRLLDPRFGHARVYWAQVEGVPSPQALATLTDGVTLTDGPARAVEARTLPEEPALPPRDPPIRVRRHIPATWIALTLTEGRNRQVRRMTAAVGHPTLRLVRVAIGQLKLGNLQPGEWRTVGQSDIL